MDDVPYKNELDPKTKAILFIFVLLVIGAIVGIIISNVSLGFLQEKIGDRPTIRTYWSAFSSNYTLVTIVICMNLSLLVGLLSSYVSSFRKTKSNFLLGLVLFLGVLFAQSLLSLPILDLILLIGTINPQIGFSCILLSYQSVIFPILANMFETIALIILFYLSME